jgi:hypothetical protein
MVEVLVATAVLAAFEGSVLSGYSVQGRNATPGPNAPSGSFDVRFHPSEWPNVLLTPAVPWDWSKARALSFEVANPGPDPVELGVRFDDDPSADGWLHCRTGSGTVPPGKAQHWIVVFGPDPMSVGMRGLPPIPGGINVASTGGGTFERAHVTSLQFFTHAPSHDVGVKISNVRTLPAGSLSFDGIVDRYGQFTGADWPGKLHGEEELAARRRKEHTELESAPALPGRDRFGGDADGPHLKATGFFRTEKLSGKWWLVDPDGRRFFSMGIDCLTPEESTFITGRNTMFRDLPTPGDALLRFEREVSGAHSGPVLSGQVFDFYGANLYRKYGTDWRDAWKDVSLRRLPSWGFNTIGNWSEEAFMRNERVPYVATGGIGGSHARLSSGSDYWSTMHDPFDPQFAKDVAESLPGLVRSVKGDPWCVGYFIDNELSWAGSGEDAPYGLAVGAFKADKDSPGKMAFLSQLRSKYDSIAGMNMAWGTHFPSWDALNARVQIKEPLNAAQRDDCSIFVHALALRYFGTIRDELKRLDPDHLYLGCRFAWFGPEAERAAAEVCDVVSYNVYAPRVDPAKWSHLAELGKPCIIGEFHFGALDRGMFHPGLVSTPNQDARSAMYEDYVTSALQNPSLVGCHWFQYVDEPLTGRWFDGENYNIGFLSVTDTPYPEMVAAARRVHARAYKIREAVPSR